MAVVPPRSELCARLATAFDVVGEPEQALGWTQRGLALRPGNAEAMSELLRRAGVNPNVARLAEALGWVLAMLGLTLWFLSSNLALQYGAARLPANTTAVVMISEVFFASASAVALGAGSLGLREALGALMILGGALLATVQKD